MRSLTVSSRTPLTTKPVGTLRTVTGMLGSRKRVTSGFCWLTITAQSVNESPSERKRLTTLRCRKPSILDPRLRALLRRVAVRPLRVRLGRGDGRAAPQPDVQQRVLVALLAV